LAAHEKSVFGVFLFSIRVIKTPEELFFPFFPRKKLRRSYFHSIFRKINSCNRFYTTRVVKNSSGVVFALYERARAFDVQLTLIHLSDFEPQFQSIRSLWYISLFTEGVFSNIFQKNL